LGMSFRRLEDYVARLELLGQRWARQDPHVQEYACNTQGDKVARLNFVIERLRNREREGEAEALETLKQLLIEIGTAEYLASADVLTNLAIKVGSYVRHIKARRT